MNAAVMDATITQDEARKRETDEYKQRLRELVSVKMRAINAYATVIIGELERKYHTYNDPKTIGVSFVEYTNGRTTSELIGPEVIEFIKENRRFFTTQDVLDIQDIINATLQSRGLTHEIEDGLNLMYAIGVCVDPFIRS